MPNRTTLADWLATHGLTRYADLLLEHQVDLDILPALTEQDLEKIGIQLGDRKRLLQAITRLDAQAPTPTAAPPLDSASPHVQSAESTQPSGQRRQLTVMFCDLVGSTALSERLDPEELRALLHEYRMRCGEVIARYDGHVARYVGDGILTYFGWPKAHEEDAERSIRAALEIIQAVKRVSFAEPLSVRIGIATGSVVVGEQAGEGDQSKLAVGSTPNLAARLQGLAAADQIVIAASTLRLVGNVFECANLGEHQLKGIANPVRAFRVEGIAQTEDRFEARTASHLTALVGREEEIALLLRRWQEAQEGEGRVVLLSGEPGVGKSRLTHVLRERLAPQQYLALRYQCSPYHVNSALYPTIEHFERAAGFRREDSAEQKLDKMHALLAGSQAQIAEVAPLFAAMLSLPLDRYPPLNLSPQKQKEKTLEALAEQVEALAQRQPLLIIYEDVHWIDATSQEALDLLVPRLRDLAVLVIVTYRPEYSPRWTDQAHVSTLGLNRLGRRQGAELVLKLTGGKALPAEVLDQILAHTDGVPLFIEELTKSVLESRLLHEESDRYTVQAPLPPLAIPTTLRDSLIARLDRLAPIREVAQIGACIGREFSYELLATLSPLKGARLDDALEQFTRAGLVFRRGTPPDALYTFKHALVQDAAYDSVLKSKRAQLHAQIAAALETGLSQTAAAQPELIAYHYTAAEMLEKAIPYWQKAGELAQQRVALQEAIAHLERGISLVQRLPSSRTRDAHELGLRTALGMAWIALRGYAYPQVGENLQRARELEQELNHGVHSLQVLMGLWMYTHSIGHIREGLIWAEELLVQATRNNSEDMRLAGHWAASNAYYCLGEFTQVIHHADTSLARYDALRDRHLADLLNLDPKTTAKICKALAEWALGFPDRAARISEEGITHARTRGHPFNFGWALYFSATALDSWRGDVDLCAAKLDEFERLARDQRLVFFEHVVGPLLRAIWLFISDRPQEAEIKFAESIPRWTASGLGTRLPNLKTLHAQSAALSGRLDLALSLVEEALEQIARPGWEERYFLAEALRVKGWILHRSADLAEAEACFRSAIDVACQQQAKSWELRAATSYALLMDDKGQRKDALAVLQPVYNWFTEGFDTKDLKDAKALLEELRS